MICVIVVSICSAAQGATLRRYPLFAHAAAPSLARIENSLSRRTLRSGENLWWMGDPAVHLTLIEGGLLKLAQPGARGSSSIIGLFGPREPIGLPAAIEATAYIADSIVISSTAQIVQVSAAVVRQEAIADRGLASAVQKALLAHVRILLSKIEVTSAGAVEQRLATLLLRLGDRFGEGTKEPGRVALPVTLTRATLAGLIDARVETVIRTFSIWRSSEICRSTDDGFDLDRAALGAISQQG